MYVCQIEMHVEGVTWITRSLLESARLVLNIQCRSSDVITLES
jgi:hypothetical protein